MPARFCDDLQAAAGGDRAAPWLGGGLRERACARSVERADAVPAPCGLERGIHAGVETG